MKSRRRVKNFFPDPKFQFKFLRFVLFTSFVPILITGFGIGYFVHQNYTLLVDYVGPDEAVRRTLYAELRTLITGIGVVFTFYFLAVLALGVVFSHRVAGALYAVRRTLRELNEGKDVRLQFRDKDEFQELVSEFNAVAEKLKSR